MTFRMAHLKHSWIGTDARRKVEPRISLAVQRWSCRAAKLAIGTLVHGSAGGSER